MATAVAATGGRRVLREFGPPQFQHGPCLPPGSSALVWGWAPEIFVEQDWQNTVPYPNVLGMAINPAIRDSAEPIMRAGIDQASCVVDATNVKRPNAHPCAPSTRWLLPSADGDAGANLSATIRTGAPTVSHRPHHRWL